MSLIDFYAPCPRNFEDLLMDELKSLGASQIQAGLSGVSFSGSRETLYRVCLGSRIASRLLMKIGEAELSLPAAPEDLYAAVREIPWGDHYPADALFSVRATGGMPGLDNSRFNTLKVKDGIADSYREAVGQRPSVDRQKPDMAVEVRLEKHKNQGNLTFYLDMSGGSLSHRGYRVESTTAPLRENLAAGLLMQADWLKVLRSGGSLADPFCGSGTLLIEGALMAAGVPVNILRGRYGFGRWKGHDRDLFRRMRQKGLDKWKTAKEKLPRIVGFDRSGSALRAAAANLKAAGLHGRIELHQADMTTLTADDLKGLSPGLVCTNPPYGHRLEEASEMEELYRQLGYQMRRVFTGWALGMITSDRNLIYATGLKSSGVKSTKNGDLDAFLVSFPAKQGDPLEALSESGVQFLNRLKKNIKARRKMARRAGVTSYRLYDADLPDYNAAVDYYEGRWVVVQEYAPPVEIEENKANRRLREMITALVETLEISPADLFLKQRRRQKGKSQYRPSGQSGPGSPGQTGPDRRQSGSAPRGIGPLIAEGESRFLVNFTDYIDVGVFLDHRPLRTMIHDQAAGRSFLNLFAYTGTASLRAAAGGARRTVTVDASATYLDWARENFRINEIQGIGTDHAFIRSDVFRYLEDCREAFDLIMADPPTFSNSKNRTDIFDVQRDHGTLLQAAWDHLSPGGTLYFSCNFRKFKMEWSPPAEGKMRNITPQTIDFDFSRNQKIHYCWEITRPLDTTEDP